MLMLINAVNCRGILFFKLILVKTIDHISQVFGKVTELKLHTVSSASLKRFKIATISCATGRLQPELYRPAM